jgi:beta-1,4-mannosyl-glycoprotein beta-1,4-N-acetylglucosaminyltransferase
MAAKVIATFPYNGEPVVELQLAYLSNVVDEFVLVEAATTFSGRNKSQMYMDTFADILRQYPNVTLLKINEFPEMPADWPEKKGQEYMTPESYESWFRENYQRDYVAEYIKNKYKGQYYIVIGIDADEIPKKEFVQELRKNYFAFNECVYLQMEMFYYNFAWVKKYPWYHPFIVNDVGFGKYTLSDMRTRLPKRQVMKGAGWHASYFLTKKDLIRKIEGFAHRECDITHRKCNEFLNQCLYLGLDISERGEAENLVPYDVNILPVEFVDFQEKMVFLQRYAIL